MVFVALLTDFGNSEYVGIIKGVIYGINPNVKIIDITHNIRKFDVKQAAMILYSSYKYFPKGTIFVCVVDPGVGTERRAVIIKTRDYFFIGPDNGIFSLINNVEKIIEIDTELFNASYTFHARDIFAPIAAYISKGSCITDFGKEINEINRIINPAKKFGNKIYGEIVYYDDFGNAITNIPADYLKIKFGSVIKLVKDEKTYNIRFVKTYGYAKEGELVCLIGSNNFIEISVNKGSAKNVLKDTGNIMMEILY